MKKNKIVFATAVLTLLGGSALFASNDVEAKTNVKVNYDKTIKTPGTIRNVETTGNAALYNKISSLPGAKQIASKNTLKKLDKSNNPDDYFRVYRVAQTNDKKVYYKVVSFDGQYRGWIYGGKDPKKFTSGIKSAETTKPVSISQDAFKTFKLTDPTSKHVTWNIPTGSQYKPKKVVNSMAAYNDDDLRIIKGVQINKSGEKYYYIKSSQHPEINGWINHQAIAEKKAGSSTENNNQKPNPESPNPGIPGETPQTPTPPKAFSFNYTDAQVNKNSLQAETNTTKVKEVQELYKTNVLKGLALPYRFSTSTPLAEIQSKLGYGKRITTKDGKHYIVIVTGYSNRPVIIVPFTKINYINPTAKVTDIDLLEMFVDEKTMGQIQSAANLYYKLNYLGSLIIFSPMSDSMVNRLLGADKQLTIDVEPFLPELPIKVKFDIKPKIERDANGIKNVDVDLALDSNSLTVPNPENPVNWDTTQIDMSKSGIPSFLQGIVRPIVEKTYGTRYPVYKKVDQKMSNQKINTYL